jgi:molecular chaperone DnaK
MSNIIGIDLGTTNCCVAVVKNGIVQIVPNKDGGRSTPNVVWFPPKGERVTGQIAKRQILTNADSTIYAINRLYGRRFDTSEVQHLRKLMPYEILESPGGYACVRINGRAYTLQELSGTVLQKLKIAAEDFLGERVSRAVISVPADFDELQRQIVLEAGEIAGLKIERIIKEPAAAALAYGIGKNKLEYVAVFDLGGGTFNVSILEIHNGIYRILSNAGDNFLGGEDFDERIVIWMVNNFQEQTGIDLRQDKVAMQRLKEASEIAKCELSFSTESVINLPFISTKDLIPLHLQQILTRDKLEQLIGDLVARTIEPSLRALWEADLRPESLNKILLVGGQTRAPFISQIVREIFGKAPSSEIDPDEVVAIGTAIQAAILNGQIKNQVLLDVLPKSLGIKAHDGKFIKILEANAVIPTSRTMVFTTIADYQKSVEIQIVQGEHDIAENNLSLGKIELIGIPPTLRGTLPIEICFEVDSNNNLHVSAYEALSGLKQELKIKPATDLLPDELEVLVAEMNGETNKDKYFKEIATAKDKLEAMIHNVQRIFKMYGSTLPDEKQESGQAALFSSIVAFTSEDLDIIQHAVDSVEQLHQHLTYAILNMPFAEENITSICLASGMENGLSNVAYINKLIKVHNQKAHKENNEILSPTRKFA